MFGCRREVDLTRPAPQEAEAGRLLYGEHCSDCHGDKGEGGEKSPPVMGDGSLPLKPMPGTDDRKVDFATGKDVYEWMKETMPADDAGSRSDGEYMAVLAFLLKERANIGSKTAGDLLTFVINEPPKPVPTSTTSTITR
jgi:mono/diheme cytochrome c family protein